MNENENNFEELRELLKLKRYEIPPPRYFNEFSSNVIAGIRAGKNRDSVLERPSFLNFFNLFQTKPGVLGGMATSICILLFVGVILADRTDTTPPNFLDSAPSLTTGAPLASAMTSALTPAPNSGIIASTNPITSLQPVATLFGQPGAPSIFQPASFSPSGN